MWNSNYDSTLHQVQQENAQRQHYSYISAGKELLVTDSGF